MADPLQPHGLWPTRLLCPWGFPGESPGVRGVSPSWDLPYRGIESWSLVLAGGFFIPRTTPEARGSQYSILSVIYVKITNWLALPPWADSPWPPPWGASGFPTRILRVQYRNAGGGVGERGAGAQPQDSQDGTRFSERLSLFLVL